MGQAALEALQQGVLTSINHLDLGAVGLLLAQLQNIDGHPKDASRGRQHRALGDVDGLNAAVP
jgi:hypothetical protein